MKLNQGDTAGDLTSTVWKDRWNVRGSWIHTTNQHTALSLMSMEIPQNGPQYTTITEIWVMLPNLTALCALIEGHGNGKQATLPPLETKPSEQYHLSHILWFNITTVILHTWACQVSNTRMSNGASIPEHEKGRDTSSIIQPKRFDAQHKKYWPLGGRRIWCSVHSIKSKETEL
jgi:hypothetical protein